MPRAVRKQAAAPAPKTDVPVSCVSLGEAREALLRWHKSTAMVTGSMSLAYGRSIKRSELTSWAEQLENVANSIRALVKRSRGE